MDVPLGVMLEEVFELVEDFLELLPYLHLVCLLLFLPHLELLLLQELLLWQLHLEWFVEDQLLVKQNLEELLETCQFLCQLL